MQPQENPLQQVLTASDPVPKSPGRFQRFLPWLIFLSLFWLTFGRAFLGVGGWGVIGILFTIAPLLLLYTVTVGAILHRKEKRGYRMTNRTQNAFMALLTSIFAFGFFAPDAGDTRESYRSVFSAIFGINGASSGLGYDHPLLQFSGVATSICYMLGAVMLIVALAMLVNDKNGERVEPSNSDAGQSNPA